MKKIAEKTGMSRPSLYKTLADGATPPFETIMNVLKAIGGQINVKPSA
jgi:probable addiction module antidote protein